MMFKVIILFFVFSFTSCPTIDMSPNDKFFGFWKITDGFDTCCEVAETIGTLNVSNNYFTFSSKNEKNVSGTVQFTNYKFRGRYYYCEKYDAGTYINYIFKAYNDYHYIHNQVVKDSKIVLEEKKSFNDKNTNDLELVLYNKPNTNLINGVITIGEWKLEFQGKR